MKNLSTYHAQIAERAVEELGDGEWHPYERTVRMLMKLVPPGPAVRRAERMRENGRNNRTPGVRSVAPRPARATEDVIYTGARQIVIEFLRNSSFETDKAGSQRIGANHDRHIRMIRVPRSIASRVADPLIAVRDRLQKERDQLELENERLRDQVTNLRAYLYSLGKSKRADELAPPLEGSGDFD